MATRKYTSAVVKAVAHQMNSGPQAYKYIWMVSNGVDTKSTDFVDANGVKEFFEHLAIAQPETIAPRIGMGDIFTAVPQPFACDGFGSTPEMPFLVDIKSIDIILGPLSMRYQSPEEKTLAQDPQDFGKYFEKTELEKVLDEFEKGELKK